MIRLKNIKELAYNQPGNGRARAGPLVSLKPMLFFVGEEKNIFSPLPF